MAHAEESVRASSVEKFGEQFSGSVLEPQASIPTESPGALCDRSLQELVGLIESDVSCGVRAACSFPLCAACEPEGELLHYLEKVLSSRKLQDWKCLMQVRIGISYKVQCPDLIWLDDKVRQVDLTAAHVGRQLHMPIYAHAAADDTASQEALRAEIRRRVHEDLPIVVKPRHGSNSKHVHIWPRPKVVGEAVALEAAEAALTAWHFSWKKESWNQNAVPKGALVQPMYAPILALIDAHAQLEGNENRRTGDDEEVIPRLLQPLELKTQVLFGEVVGAFLNTYAHFLWVSREGVIHFWNAAAPGLLRKKHGHTEPLPSAALQVLQIWLARHWLTIRADSERLAHGAGLDEIRVDWLLGDDRWGLRVGELTYLGLFAADILPVQRLMARAFAEAHLSRKRAEEPNRDVDAGKTGIDQRWNHFREASPSLRVSSGLGEGFELLTKK